MDIRPGDTVFGAREDDKYQVIQFVNAGRFGFVYKVVDSEGNPLALKTISTYLLDDEDLSTLINEGTLATEIQHSNVLPVVFFHDGTKYQNLPPYMLMEYADGGSLAGILKTQRQSKQFFAIEDLRTMFVQLASGMKAINEKLVHRDVKPDNILIVKDTLKISDFGLSKIVGAATRSQTLKGINHIRYCAPEAWYLDCNTPAMDMYSLGIVFYELATLANPYDVDDSGNPVDAWKNAHLTKVPEDPRKRNPDLPLWLVQLVTKMMSKRPQDRYSSWDDVIDRCKETREAPTADTDVSDLVGNAFKAQQKREHAELKAEEERRRKIESLKIVAYCFQEVASDAKKIVDAFNQSSEFAKLRVTRLDQFFFLIKSDRRRDAAVEVQISPTQAGHKLDDRIIKAWGHARLPSGRGFNLILVASSYEDLYGEWVALQARHHPGVRLQDNRPEPFAFEISELPGEIQLLNAAHIYDTDKQPYSRDMFKPLIGELLRNG
jgi:serine/threonine protein kinase